MRELDRLNGVYPAVHDGVDEESLRLIKELQATDMGLRCRSGRASRALVSTPKAFHTRLSLHQTNTPTSGHGSPVTPGQTRQLNHSSQHHFRPSAATSALTIEVSHKTMEDTCSHQHLSAHDLLGTGPGEARGRGIRNLSLYNYAYAYSSRSTVLSTSTE